MTDIYLVGFFHDKTTLEGKGGLTVTADVRLLDGTLVATNQAAFEVGGGGYGYLYTSATPVTVLAVFKSTSADVILKHVPALAVLEVQRIDATISGIPALVWASATRTLTSFGTLVSDISTALAGIPALVWDVLIAGHLTAGTTGKKLSSLCCSLGGGANTFIYTVTETSTLLPIQGVLVIVTTDAAGNNEIAQSSTNAFGQVTFYLDSGTYYFWRIKANTLFVNPDTEVIP